MFQRILNKIAGDYNAKQIRKIQPLLTQIDQYYHQYQQTLSPEQIPDQTRLFQDRLHAGESLDALLPEAFALVKYACETLYGSEIVVRGNKQIWNMIPYDVQLIGAIILHQGKIAEMKTGEGKTLVATLPLYLNALMSRGAHLVTVNDYLALRDSEQMSYLYQRLGLTVGCVTKAVKPQDRKAQYQQDITYVENSELGFDYLRDNLVTSLQARSLTWRPLYYAIIDEADSILIDEARTPLIISQPSAEATDKYIRYAQIIRQLSPCSTAKKKPGSFLKDLLDDARDLKKPASVEDGDFYIDEKHKTATLSGRGIAKLESILGVSNLYKDLGYDEIHHIENALKASNCFVLDKDYIVSKGEVLIVDEHTGRTMPGRRYSEGLHQAIEAKEGLKIQKESQTLATITYQNFFKLYDKIAGMTGTATTEGEEFEKIYELEVLSIPTHRPCIRIDQSDKVYFNQKAKRDTVCQTIKFYHQMGVPQLIGTSSIYTSEYVSDLLRQMSIQHYVLNAKYHEQEAQIIAGAGQYGSVVVATNMAGRGTDIKLQDGLNEQIADQYIKWISKTLAGDSFSNSPASHLKLTIYSAYEYELLTTRLDQAGIAYTPTLHKSHKIGENHYAKMMIQSSAGASTTLAKDCYFGLMIIGTEKHDSRRIDNQLRGRSGRQGDPGSSQFFVALDDEIMRKMGGSQVQSIASMLLPAEELNTLELTQKQFTSSIQRAQKQMEAYHFGIRKHLFDYDNVINKQRHNIYHKRDHILGVQKTESDSHPYIRKVLILHGFAGHPDSGWKARLQTQLEAQDIQVRAPHLIHADQPVLEEQIQQVRDLCGDQLDEHTAIVGHSLGGLLAQHLAIRIASQGRKLGLVLGVAPAYHGIARLSEDVVASRPELLQGIDHLYAYQDEPVSIVDYLQGLHDSKIYLSQTDPSVNFDEAYRYFSSQYPGIQIQVFEDMKHFNSSAGMDTLPQALEDIIAYQPVSTAILDDILTTLPRLISDRIAKYRGAGMDGGECIQSIEQDFGISFQLSQTESLAQVQEEIIAQMTQIWKQKVQDIDPVRLVQFFKDVYLATIDKYRVQHIDEMQYLREKVGLYGYAQMDPLVMYKQEAYEKFETLLETIQVETLSVMFKTDFQAGSQPVAPTDPIHTDRLTLSGGDGALPAQELGDIVRFAQQVQGDMQQGLVGPGSLAGFSQDGLEVLDLSQLETKSRSSSHKQDDRPVITASHKTRPNDPCPCGSGKKYKKCHGV